MSKGDLEVAYRLIENSFVSENSEDRARGNRLYKSNPSLASIAHHTFSEGKLLESIASYGPYGLQASFDHEMKRLALYKLVTTPEKYADAKRILDNVYLNKLAHKKIEEEALVKKNKAEEEEKIRAQKRKIEETERLKENNKIHLKKLMEDLALAESNATRRCKDKTECDKVFALTQIYVNAESDMKIQLATDSIIETFNATDEQKISMKAIKVPGVGSSSMIILSVGCKGNIEDCSVLKLSRYRGYTDFLQKMLK